jgi:hypothetical protein
MQESGIAAYAQSLASRLSFDPSLSRRVRLEVEDHLCETVAAVAPDEQQAAAQRAIAGFGDPRVLAVQFATGWLAKQTQKVGITVMLVIAGVFMAMKARIAWYGTARWELSDEVRAAAKMVGAIDVYAFWCSVILAAAALVYLIVSRTPTAHAARCRQLSCVACVTAAASAALAVSIVSDGVLTAFRLVGSELSAAFLIPILSMVFEIVSAGIVIPRVISLLIRAARTTELIET